MHHALLDGGVITALINGAAGAPPAAAGHASACSGAWLHAQQLQTLLLLLLTPPSVPIAGAPSSGPARAVLASAPSFSCQQAAGPASVSVSRSVGNVIGLSG